MSKRLKIRAHLASETGTRSIELVGRPAWALRKLVEAGPTGCTPIDAPGPRWSHYVYVLRRRGIVIETIHEAHGGQFAGTHARYVLRTPVAYIEDGGGA